MTRDTLDPQLKEVMTLEGTTVGTVTFTVQDASGRSRSIKTEVGTSVMEAATRSGVSGIVAECGGSLSCATCHVYLDDQWIGACGTAGDVEEEMLESAASPVEPTSRLSCQIRLTPDLDGLSLRLPPTQL